MKELKDNDLREALRRSEEKRAAVEVPADFFDSVMGKIDAEPKTVKMWRWVAAAACIALVAGIGTAILFADRTIQDKGMTARIEAEEKAEIQELNTFVADTLTEPVDAPKPKMTAPEQKAKPAAKPKPAAEPQPSPNPNLRMERPQYAKNEPKTIAADTASTNIAATEDAANTGYAEFQPKKDKPNFTPALMDEFIEMMAGIQGVSRIKSGCSIANDTIFDESFYVFPVRKDYDVLEQIVWMASNYSNTTPGYNFNNTGRQILFSIDDEPNGLNYLWIIERIDDSKIMIYSVHAPIDIEYKSDCYQQFYDDLTFANFNTYY